MRRTAASWQQINEDHNTSEVCVLSNKAEIIKRKRKERQAEKRRTPGRANGVARKSTFIS